MVDKVLFRRGRGEGIVGESPISLNIRSN